MPRISAKSVQNDTDSYLVLLGKAVRARRKELGMSQEALADASGVERSHMGKIERGERNVTVLNIIRVCEALGSKPSEIFVSAGL